DHLLSRIRDVITNRDLKRRGDDAAGVEINYGGRTHVITAERRQILDLLLSVYEVAMRRNAELAQAQANLRKLNSELEQQVRNRTHRLEESNRSLETFCYSVAHDLRAPLRSIQGYVSMLNEEATQLGSNATQTYADRASSAASRMDRMIVDLLAYGKVSHANTPFEWVDLRTKVERVVAEFAQDIATKNARVQVQVDNIRVFTSRVLLAQVLSNLLGNALKFVHPNEPPDVTIVGRLAPQGQAVQIEVRDRGIGIDLSYREKMFKVFEKLHSGAFPGTGIGLAIVQKAVQRLGGSISVDAVEGGGTRFVVLLPLGDSDPDQ
ncbi:MAG TPA: ATP-binding protein, partial [Opitutaceae bacterium]|nr:ATP-binding protein [Opitutaceae bacterium]